MTHVPLKPSVVDKLKPIAELHRAVDQWSAAAPAELVKDSPCKPGCWYCCQMMTVVSIPESMYALSKLLVEPYGPEFLEQAMPEIKRQAKMLVEPGTTNVGWFRMKIACPFLMRDRRCRIYDVRPVVCRAYRVLEGPAEKCEQIRVRVKSIDTQAVEIRTAEVMAEVAREFKLERSYPMPFPLTISFAMAGLTLGLGELRRRIRSATQHTAEYDADGTLTFKGKADE